MRYVSKSITTTTSSKIRETIAKIQAICGLAAGIGGYRRDLPSEQQSKDYAELKGDVESILALLRSELQIDLENPNHHPTLASFWSWVWTEPSGAARKEAPRRLYNPLLRQLESIAATLDSSGQPLSGADDKQSARDFVGRALLLSSPLSVLFIDLDGFKRVNDTRGHDVGDTCIELVRNAVRDVVDGKGRAFRFGGDESVVVLPNTNPQESSATAERIRASIEAAASAFEVTASIGVACLLGRSKNWNPSRLIALADSAMYSSKSAGRNRVSALLAEDEE